MRPERTPFARLLGALGSAGVGLELRDGSRLIVTNADRLTPELREEVREFRADLVEAVQAHGSELLPLFAYRPGEEEPESVSVSWRLSPEGPGWAAVRSHLLGETVLFLRDETVPIPPEAAGLVTYTRAELSILATGSEEALKEIHRAKKVFGGRVTSLNSLAGTEVERLTA